MGSTTWEWIVDHEDLVNHPERWRNVYGDRPHLGVQQQAADRSCRTWTSGSSAATSRRCTPR